MNNMKFIIWSALAAFMFLFNPTTILAQTTSTEAEPQKIDSSIANKTNAVNEDLNRNNYETAIVLNVKSIAEETTDGAKQMKSYEIQILSGTEKNKIRILSSDISNNPYGLEPQVGDKVLLFIEPNPDGEEPFVYLEGFDRRNALYTLIGLFIFVLIILAGWQGIKMAASIFFSILLIGLVLIPSFLKGINPIPISLILTLIFITISTGLTIGWNKKTLITVLGSLGGVIIAYIIAVVFADWAHLSGLSSEDDRMFFADNPELNPRGLLFAGIIIAAMSVVEDVAVTIASGVMEVRRANPSLTFKQLFRSGMIIGRDHMGAISNTLIFVYVGASLSTLLLYTQYGSSWKKFINFDSVTDDIIRSLAGTIGLAFAVPMTALFAALFASRSRIETKDN